MADDAGHNDELKYDPLGRLDLSGNAPGPALRSLPPSSEVVLTRPTGLTPQGGLSRLGGRSSRPSAVKPNAEQMAILSAAPVSKRIKVRAFAGAGKTTTLEMFSRARTGRGTYISYNKAIAEEAARRFPSHVHCRTGHSMALAAVGDALVGKRKLGNLQPATIAEMFGLEGEMGYRSAYIMCQTLSAFMVSGDEDLALEHIPAEMFQVLQSEIASKPGRTEDEADAIMIKTVQKILSRVNELWVRLLQPGCHLPLPHDAYLKVWSLSEPVIPGDYLMLDEAQDTSPVMHSVFARQRADLVLVGDKHQQIYAWRSAVDAMSKIDGDEFPLTESFRFGPAIADVANSILALKGETTQIVGRNPDRGTVGPLPPDLRHTIICRTNAGLIQHAINLAGKYRLYVVGGTAEVASLVTSALALWRGDRNGVTHPRVRPFTSWKMFEQVASSTRDRELKMIAKLIADHGHRIPSVIQQLQASLVAESDADIVLTTAHKSKGRQWDVVVLSDDFPKLLNDADEVVMDDDELNLLYVAATRACRHLVPNDPCRAAMASSDLP